MLKSLLYSYQKINSSYVSRKAGFLKLFVCATVRQIFRKNFNAVEMFTKFPGMNAFSGMPGPESI